MTRRHQPARLCLLTALVALPLLDLECQVEGADGEVDGLRVHTSHLADKRGSQITFQRLPLRTVKERETQRQTDSQREDGGRAGHRDAVRVPRSREGTYWSSRGAPTRRRGSCLKLSQEGG